MKTLKGMALPMLGLVAAIAAVGCGDAIQGCQTTAQMLGWVIVSCGFLATAIVLCGWLLAPRRKSEANASAAKSSVLPTTPTSGGMPSEMPDVR